MPNMASITVKDAANVDVVYAAGSPSSGDRVPAVWKATSKGVSWATRPTFTITTRSNASNTTRIFEVTFKYPIVDLDGVVTDVVPGTASFILPNRVSAANNKDAFVQFGNLLASSLIRSVAEEGFAPS